MDDDNEHSNQSQAEYDRSEFDHATRRSEEEHGFFRDGPPSPDNFRTGPTRDTSHLCLGLGCLERVESYEKFCSRCGYEQSKGQQTPPTWNCEKCGHSSYKGGHCTECGGTMR